MMPARIVGYRHTYPDINEKGRIRRPVSKRDGEPIYARWNPAAHKGSGGLECTINLPEGGTIKVWPDLISESVAESIYNEAINSKLFRQYPIQGGWEPRVHYLLHDEATKDFSDRIPQPGYKYSGIAMKARPLGHVQALKQIVPQLAQLCDVDSFNIGADIVLYRAGQDRIGKHSDSAQGEDCIMSLVVRSPPEGRQIMFEPKEAKRGAVYVVLSVGAKGAYCMDGALQEHYRHSVPASRDADTMDCQRMVVVLRHGRKVLVTKDNGKQVTTLDYVPPTKPYKWGGEEAFPDLVRGNCYTRQQLVERGYHRCSARGISGERSVGCDAIVVAGKSRGVNIVDTENYLVYTATSMVGAGALITSTTQKKAIRVFRKQTEPPADKFSANQIYRFDGLYECQRYEWCEEEAVYAFHLYKLNKATTAKLKSQYDKAWNSTLNPLIPRSPVSCSRNDRIERTVAGSRTICTIKDIVQLKDPNETKAGQLGYLLEQDSNAKRVETPAQRKRKRGEEESGSTKSHVFVLESELAKCKWVYKKAKIAERGGREVALTEPHQSADVFLCGVELIEPLLQDPPDLSRLPWIIKSPPGCGLGAVKENKLQPEDWSAYLRELELASKQAISRWAELTAEIKGVPTSWKECIGVFPDNASYRWRLIILLILSRFVDHGEIIPTMEKFFQDFPEPATVLQNTNQVKTCLRDMRIEKVAAASSIIRATKTMIVQFMNDIGHETFALGDNASQVKFDDEFWAILAGVDIVPNFNWEMICKWTGGNRTVGKMIAQEVYKTEPPRDGVNVNVWQDCGLAQAGHPDHRWRLIVFLILSPSIKQRVRFQEMRKLFSRFPTPGSLLRNVDEFKRFLHGRCSKHASRAEAIIRTTKRILVQFLYEAGWKSFALADDESQVHFAEDFWRDIEHVDIVPSFKWTKIRKWRGVGPKTASRIAREVFNREPPGAVQNFRESWRKWVLVDSTHPTYHWRLIVLLITSISMSDQVLPHQMEELFAEFPDPKTLLSDTEGFKSFMSGRCRYFSTVASSVIRTTKQMIVQYLQEAGWDAFCLADNDGQAVFPEDFWATLTDVDILPRYDWNKVRSWYGVGQKVGSLIAWEVYHEKHAIPVDRHVRRFLLTHWLGRAEMTVDVLAATAGKSISANDYMRVNEAIANIAQILYKSDRNNVLLTEVKVKLIKTLADISEEFDQRCQMRDFIYFYCQI